MTVCDSCKSNLCLTAGCDYSSCECVKVWHEDKCPTCNGKGYETGLDDMSNMFMKCSTCGGEDQ